MEDMNEILVRHFEGETSREEEAALEAWKAKNPGEYELLKKAWTEHAITAPPLKFDTEKAWEKVAERSVHEQRILPLFKNKALKYGMAAALLLTVGLALLWKFSFNQGSGTNELVFENPGASAKEVLLPDGSHVTLKQNARLVYKTENEEQRNMLFSGEAFFEVQKDAAHPFVIETRQGTITVLGTSFNVNAEDSMSTVSVRTGLVKLTALNSSVLLKAGETALAAKAKLSEVKMAGPNYLSWKTGEFVFENTTLPEIVRSLNTYYGNRFECANEATCKITAHFKNNSVEEIEQAIQLICGNKTVHHENKILFQ